MLIHGLANRLHVQRIGMIEDAYIGVRGQPERGCVSEGVEERQDAQKAVVASMGTVWEMASTLALTL